MSADTATAIAYLRSQVQELAAQLDRLEMTTRAALAVLQGDSEWSKQKKTGDVLTALEAETLRSLIRGLSNRVARLESIPGNH